MNKKWTNEQAKNEQMNIVQWCLFLFIIFQWTQNEQLL